jgi:hypothetical protein
VRAVVAALPGVVGAGEPPPAPRAVCGRDGTTRFGPAGREESPVPAGAAAEKAAAATPGGVRAGEPPMTSRIVWGRSGMAISAPPACAEPPVPAWPGCARPRSPRRPRTDAAVLRCSPSAEQAHRPRSRTCFPPDPATQNRPCCEPRRLPEARQNHRLPGLLTENSKSQVGQRHSRSQWWRWHHLAQRLLFLRRLEPVPPRDHRLKPGRWQTFPPAPVHGPEPGRPHLAEKRLLSNRRRNWLAHRPQRGRRWIVLRPRFAAPPLWKAEAGWPADAADLASEPPVYGVRPPLAHRHGLQEAQRTIGRCRAARSQHAVKCPAVFQRFGSRQSARKSPRDGWPSGRLQSSGQGVHRKSQRCVRLITARRWRLVLAGRLCSPDGRKCRCCRTVF